MRIITVYNVAGLSPLNNLNPVLNFERGFLLKLRGNNLKKNHIIIFAAIVFIFVVMFPLGVNAATLIKNKTGLMSFHGKWISDREVPGQDPIHQTLTIGCDVETNYW